MRDRFIGAHHYLRARARSGKGPSSRPAGLQFLQQEQARFAAEKSAATCRLVDHMSFDTSAAPSRPGGYLAVNMSQPPREPSGARMGQNLQRIAKESAFRRVKANAFHREEVPTRGFERFRTPSYPRNPCLLQERTGAMAWGPMRGSMSHRPDPRDGSRQTSLVGRLLGRPSARAARTLPSSGPLPSLWSSSAARSSRLCRPSASARPHPTVDDDRTMSTTAAGKAEAARTLPSSARRPAVSGSSCRRSRSSAGPRRSSMRRSESAAS